MTVKHATDNALLNNARKREHRYVRRRPKPAMNRVNTLGPRCPSQSVSVWRMTRCLTQVISTDTCLKAMEPWPLLRGKVCSTLTHGRRCKRTLLRLRNYQLRQAVSFPPSDKKSLTSPQREPVS